MPKKQSHCWLSLHPFGGWFFITNIIFMFLLVWTITTYAYCKEAISNPEVTAMFIVFFDEFLANDFGVLAVLLGLCFATLSVGLRMLLFPTVKQN